MFTERRANSRTSRREKQPWPGDRPFKILSLDGGGIKGVYTAELLRLCEAEFQPQGGIAACFDMIAGTSTGGIIAIGLGLGLSTDDVVGFYEQDGRHIFPPLPKTAGGQVWRVLRSLFSPMLDYNELESALKKRFGERLFGESKVRLVIPAFMMPKTEIAVFKTDHHADYRNDHLTPAWRVARATSAAPTYLKGHEHEPSGRIFIDGGVWANNPVMVGLIDALSAYDIGPNQIEILSIGTGNPPFELKRRKVFASLIAWKEVIKAAMFLTTDNATAQAKLLLGPEKVLRVEPDGPAAAVEMDDYDMAFSLLLPLAKQHFGACHGELGKFFQSSVGPRERHHASAAETS